MINRPERGIVIDRLRAFQVFGFSERTLLRYPEELLHRLVNQIRLRFVRPWILAKQMRKRRGEAERKDVVRRGVRRAAAAILEVIARPDGRVSLIQRKILAVGGRKSAAK